MIEIQPLRVLVDIDLSGIYLTFLYSIQCQMESNLAKYIIINHGHESLRNKNKTVLKFMDTEEPLTSFAANLAGFLLLTLQPIFI